MAIRISALLALCLGGLLPVMVAASEAVCVPQADGEPLCLDQPAKRVIALAPHLTESLFAVGAGGQVIAAVEYSDYPPEASDLPSVGGHRGLDLEAIVRLDPDLIVAWAQGGNGAQLEKLESMGFAVWRSQGQRLADVPPLLRGLGALTGHADQANAKAADFEQRLADLTQIYGQKTPISGFFEIWPNPLTTVTPEHYIGEAMALCGVENIVSHHGNTTPQYSTEAVIKAAPALLITTEPARDFNRWRNWPDIPAVANDGLIVLPPDLLVRIGPRLVEGVDMLSLIHI